MFNLVEKDVQVIERNKGYVKKKIRSCIYCNNITSSQRDVYDVVNVSFNTGAYKLIIVYFSSSNATTPQKLELNADGFIDTVTKIH